MGAELQRPFATVVITGIITSTAFTLLLLPLLLPWTGTLTKSGQIARDV